MLACFCSACLCVNVWCSNWVTGGRLTASRGRGSVEGGGAWEYTADGCPKAASVNAGDVVVLLSAAWGGCLGAISRSLLVILMSNPAGAVKWLSTAKPLNKT